jgi:DNA-binding response OmpR family regulator
MSVLVVEDDRALSKLLEAILRRRGITPQVVARGDDALQEIEAGSSNYEAIILDLMLPGLNGFELLQNVRGTQPHLLSRMIVLTAVSNAMLQSFEFTRFVWRVIRKPFDLEELLNVLSDCIACHSGRMPSNRSEFSRWFDRRSVALDAKAGIATVAIGRTLHVRAEFGFAAGMTTEHFPLLLDRHYPLTIAFRTGKPVWLASLTLARAEYPLLLPIWTANGSQAIAALPVASGDSVIGAIGWSFDHPQAFEERQREALSRISSDCFALIDTDHQYMRIDAES